MKTLPMIHLRAMEPEDLELLYSIENDQSLWDVGLTNVPYSRYLLHDYIANAKNDIYADGQVRLMIENQGGDVVGIVDLMHFDPKNNKAELGIVIIKKYRQQGYASAAVRMIVSYAKSVLHLHQLYALAPADNHVSLHLFLDSGFRETVKIQEWLYDGVNYRDAVLLQFFL